MTGDGSLNPWNYVQTDAKALQSLVDQGKIKIDEAYLVVSNLAPQNPNDLRQDVNTAKYLIPTIIIVAKDALGHAVKYALKDDELAKKLIVSTKDVISHVEPNSAFFKKIDFSLGSGILKNPVSAILSNASKLIDQIDDVLGFDKHLRKAMAKATDEKIPYMKLQVPEIEKLKGWSKAFKIMGKATTALKIITLADAANDLINHGSVESSMEFGFSVVGGTYCATAAAEIATLAGVSSGPLAAIVFVVGAAGSYFFGDVGSFSGKDMDAFTKAKNDFLSFKNAHPDLPEIVYKVDDNNKAHAGVVVRDRNGKMYVEDIDEYLKKPENKKNRTDLSQEYELFKKMDSRVENCNECLPSRQKTSSHQASPVH
jgi:hypothetical protein